MWVTIDEPNPVKVWCISSSAVKGGVTELSLWTAGVYVSAGNVVDRRVIG